MWIVVGPIAFLLLISILALPEGRGADPKDSRLRKAEARLRAIYDHREFRAKSFRADWLPDSSGYTVMEPAPGADNRVLARYDAASGKRAVIESPRRERAGSVSNELVSTLDICQTIVQLAGAKPAYELHGRYLFGEDLPARQYIHFNRDKMDNTHDAMRAVRNDRYKLIHNLMPERAYCQLNEYKERQYPILALMNVLNMQGKLNPVQARFMAASKPEFELYDLDNDPHEINNLANDPKHAATKAALLAEINRWREEVKDVGVTEEFRGGGWTSEYPTKSLEGWQSILNEREQALLAESKASRGGRKKKK